MNLSHLLRALATAACLLAVAGCTALAATPAPPTAAPTSASDNPTAGAIARATRQAVTQAAAAATRQAATTAAQAAALASQTAVAAAASTAQASTQAAATQSAQATGQAIMAVQAAWPVRLHESFADNHLGWPAGPLQDHLLAITTTVASGRYDWLTAVTDLSDQGTYTNLLPTGGPAVSDFSASVTIQFAHSQADSQSAFGLVFRDSVQGFGFFGLMPSGQGLVAQSHPSLPNQVGFDLRPPPDTRPAAANRLSVVGLGSSFVFLVNNQIVYQMPLNLPAGTVGLGVQALAFPDTSQVSFSDFELRAP